MHLVSFFFYEDIGKRDLSGFPVLATLNIMYSSVTTNASNYNCRQCFGFASLWVWNSEKLLYIQIAHLSHPPNFFVFYKVYGNKVNLLQLFLKNVCVNLRAAQCVCSPGLRDCDVVVACSATNRTQPSFSQRPIRTVSCASPVPRARLQGRLPWLLPLLWVGCCASSPGIFKASWVCTVAKVSPCAHVLI